MRFGVRGYRFGVRSSGFGVRRGGGIWGQLGCGRGIEALGLVLQQALVGEAVQADVVHLDAMHGDQRTVGTHQGAEGNGRAGGLVYLAFKAPAYVFHLQVHLQVVEGGFEEDGTPLAPLAQSHLLDEFLLVGTDGVVGFAVPSFEPVQCLPILGGEGRGQGAEAMVHGIHRGNALALGSLGAAGLAAIVSRCFSTSHG